MNFRHLLSCDTIEWMDLDEGDQWKKQGGFEKFKCILIEIR